MGETAWLSSDGPHGDDYTSEVAAALSEAVHVLNHATLSHTGVTYPSTVYDVLGRIGVSAVGLDQLLGQLGGGLRRMLASGQLADDQGDPAKRLDKAMSELAAARDLADRIDRAFNTTASLHLPRRQPQRADLSQGAATERPRRQYRQARRRGRTPTARNERIGAPPIMTAFTTRNQPTPRVVLPSGPPRLTPGAASELLAVLLEAHQSLQTSRPDAA
ncbi:hypothetical protein GCM10010149_59010 [Nonomuraea roseoviolacea subsp. roseoviolacea]